MADKDLRSDLVTIALQWQARFGVAPHITNAISEYDAAILVGHTPESYSRDCEGRTAVTKGTDFTFGGLRYQVKGSRPSGRPGSDVTKLGKAANYDWDRLIWLLYDTQYKLIEAWEWGAREYEEAFHNQAHIRPPHMRRGRRMFPTAV